MGVGREIYHDHHCCKMSEFEIGGALLITIQLCLKWHYKACD
jgi:hypothetical protein